jgi:hypothetical protein
MSVNNRSLAQGSVPRKHMAYVYRCHKPGSRTEFDRRQLLTTFFESVRFVPVRREGGTEPHKDNPDASPHGGEAQLQ